MSAIYKIKQGENILDTILNSTGSVITWEDILNLNSFDTWTPDLSNYFQLVSPDIIDQYAYEILQKYPLCNGYLPDIINILAVLNSISEFDTCEIAENSLLTDSYIVKQGELISDIVLNSTGSILNWETFLNANNFDTWTPDLISGQKLIIEYDQLQRNVLRTLQVYPLCTTKVYNWNAQIKDLISNFAKSDYIQFSPDGDYIQFSPDGDYIQFNN